MHFDDFTDKIDSFKTKKLGGRESQFKLVPKIRLQISDEIIKQKTPKLAAVLALIYPDKHQQTKILLTERASYKGTHSAQISFPGGKKDTSDLNLQQTALREAFEEVGITKTNIAIVRQLTETYIPPSNFMVTPFLGISTNNIQFKPNYEVEKIIEVNIDDLLHDKNITSVIKNTSYMENLKVPCFKLNGYEVWGATAMILSEIKDLIK